MYSKIQKLIKNTVIALGVILWVGALSPEIFIEPGNGCILDENGEELTPEAARDFMEAYFYADEEDKEVKIRYKLAIFNFFLTKLDKTGGVTYDKGCTDIHTGTSVCRQ